MSSTPSSESIQIPEAGVLFIKMKIARFPFYMVLIISANMEVIVLQLSRQTLRMKIPLKVISTPNICFMVSEAETKLAEVIWDCNIKYMKDVNRVNYKSVNENNTYCYNASDCYI